MDCPRDDEATAVDLNEIQVEVRPPAEEDKAPSTEEDADEEVKGPSTEDAIVEEEQKGPSSTEVVATVSLSAMTTENLLRMLECAICKDYLATATQTSCCGTVFCKRCIRTWVRAKGTCPVCRKSHSLENLVPAHYVQRIANEMRADLCPPDEDVDMATTDVATPPFPNGAQAAHVHPPNDPILPNQNGVRQLDIRSGPNGSFIFTCPFTIGIVCTAVRNRNAVDHSVRMTIKSADNVVAAHVELLPHSDQYLATDHWNQDLAAISYAATNPIVAVPLPGWRWLDDPNDMIMRAYEPQSRRDTIWTQVRRPDTARVFSMVAKSDPFWNFSRSRNWHGKNGRVRDESTTLLVLVRPTSIDEPMLTLARSGSDRQRFWLDFLGPIAPAQAVFIALTCLDRHRRFLRSRDD
ncbi:hypothetical protein DYB36_005377 [Aphanomyces astaci]|uniref:RING-type domain-containing protein n=1 Tax=Aphanomyces astaci TaxID=112090 RepID=A0A397AN20_APHAT|nr:hypothetical protein DYB36_005377 [Aphanomyces astaci]